MIPRLKRNASVVVPWASLIFASGLEDVESVWRERNAAGWITIKDQICKPNELKHGEGSVHQVLWEWSSPSLHLLEIGSRIRPYCPILWGRLAHRRDRVVGKWVGNVRRGYPSRLITLVVEPDECEGGVFERLVELTDVKRKSFRAAWAKETSFGGHANKVVSTWGIVPD